MAADKILIEQPASGDARVFLHDSRPPDQGTEPLSERGSVMFSDPLRIITCRDASDIGPAFDAIERALDAGQYVAGAFAYELGYQLEEKLTRLAPDVDAPLFQVGVFRTMTRLQPDQAADLIADRAALRDGGGHGGGHQGGNLHYHMEPQAYDEVMARLHTYILAGDIYQANFTFPVTFPWQGDVWHLYGAVAPYQKVAFGAVVDLPDYQIASFSPELFFRKRGRIIESRPMKGTMRRGATLGEDRALGETLRTDQKNRAENLMIVDLIRNDLGRIARIGSVSVDHMFQIETYDTLHQMVSTVRADVAGEPTVQEIFRHLFPCGSVTGAPKIRAMEIIAELEDTARGIYTGAIGYLTPERDMCFSVPIRTVSLPDQGEAIMGIGSGIVADSRAGAEYEECFLKARFLSDALAGSITGPGLIETMRGRGGVIALLDHHRARLRQSAAFLGISVAEDDLWNAVLDHASQFSDVRRIRLHLEPGGKWRIESAPLMDPPGSPPVVVISTEQLQSDDPLLAHKTTHRAVYDRARKILKDVENGFDCLLFNERGELCEGAIGNIFLRLDGELVTPALSCGLVAGVMRACVIEEQGACERVLYEDDLRRAETVYLSNAVRGLMEVQLQD